MQQVVDIDEDKVSASQPLSCAVGKFDEVLSEAAPHSPLPLYPSKRHELTSGFEN